MRVRHTWERMGRLAASVVVAVSLVVAGCTNDGVSVPTTSTTFSSTTSTSLTQTGSATQSTVPPNYVLTVFIPEVSVDQGQAALELTLLDGTTLEIEWPETLDLLSGGVTPYGWARIEGGAARDFYIRYGDVVDVIAQFGPATQVGKYPDNAGGVVSFWRPTADEVDYLGFQFGGWAVLVYDYRTAGEGRMTDESRALWATHFHGSITDEGFLRLSADPPLTLARAGEYPSPMSMTLWSPTGLVFLIPGPCQPGFMSPIDEDDHAFWCDTSGRLSIEVSGPPEYQQQVHDELSVVFVDFGETSASGS